MSVNALQLDMLKTSKIREICRDLKIRTSGNSEQVKSTLLLYLSTEEGRERAYQKLKVSMLERLFGDEDPIKTLVSSSRPETVDTSVMTNPTLADSLERKGKNIRCVCLSGSYPLKQCETCGTYQHWGCMGRNVTMLNYECIFCQMAALDLSQQILDALVMPFSLPREDPQITNKKMQRKFSFTSDHLRKLESGQGTVRVFLFCMKIDGIGYNNIWPSSGAVILNDRTILEPHKMQERQDVPLDITELLVGGENSLSVLKYNDYQYYVSGIFLVKTLSLPEVREKIYSSIKIKSEEEGIAFVKQKFTESEVDIDTITVTFKCPLSLKVLDDPVRGAHCTHLNCFGLEAYIMYQTQQIKNRWNCPICHERCNKVVRDEYFEKILMEAKIFGANSVEFKRDGSYVLCASKSGNIKEINEKKTYQRVEKRKTENKVVAGTIEID
ncbi:unnamed protein product [Blepharisma stoltei]|uniref:SP-RING-type domain-containing protein n=1 Tax=Blepharisma stoltei TaxID=1481888 RepID=A0AAU9JK17_9CILI|nr:unnamed protein product [Blepharisma stoltei]